MQILLVLIPVSLLLLVAAVGAFFWAVKRGQFENLDRAALDVLVDDDPVPRRVPAPLAAGSADATDNAVGTRAAPAAASASVAVAQCGERHAD